jgi:aminoglycoside phosphotransferase (APT) family kinase protein
MFEGQNVSAVLDWERSHLGHPAELALEGYATGKFDEFLLASTAFIDRR